MGPPLSISFQALQGGPGRTSTQSALCLCNSDCGTPSPSLVCLLQIVQSAICYAGKPVAPCDVQEVLAPGSAITDKLQSRISLWGVRVPLGDALLVSAQAST